MKTGITFFTVIFFSFLLQAAGPNCAQTSCATGAEYTGPDRPNYDVPKTPVKAAVTQPATAPVPAKAVSTANQPAITTLESCLRKWDQKAQECLSAAETAKKSCDQRNADSETSDVQKYTKGITESKVSQNAGKGSATECAKISLIGNTAVNGMNVFKETCEDDFAKCSTECTQAIEATESSVIADECLKYATTVDEQNEISNTIMKIITAGLNGRKICMVEAKAEKDLLNDLLSTISKSTQAAKTCVCKFSVDTGGNCEAIPNPKDCLTGGKLAGTAACNVYSNDNCALGSLQFNSTPCQCARDNSAAICRTAAAIAPSNFALDLKPSPGGISAGAGGLDGAGESGSNLNLGGGYNINKPASEIKPEDKDKITGNGYANGNGSAGGSGSSASGGNSNPGAAAQEEDGSSKTGLAGLFNQVKSSFGNNKTGSNNKKNGFGNRSSSSRESGLNYDVDKWRPRGPAGANCQSSQMRCKNEDIFVVMNNRYRFIDTTFILQP